MKKILCVLCFLILFVSLLGANSSIVTVRTAEGKVPGKSFGESRGLSKASTDEIFEGMPKAELKNSPTLDIKVVSLVYGGDPEKSAILSQMRSFSDVVDSVVLPSGGCNGS